VLQRLLRLSHAIDAFNERIGRVAAWAIVVAVIVSATNAIIRKVFGVSSNAWLELQWYLFGAVFLLCAAWTLKANEHIRIDIVSNNYSRQGRNWVELFGHLFFLLPFVALMTWLLVPYVQRSAGITAATAWPFIEFVCRLGIATLAGGGLVFLVLKRHEANGFLKAIGLGLAALLAHLFLDNVTRASALYGVLRPGWEISSNAGGLLIWPAKALILIGFILLGLQWLSEVIKRLAIMAGLIPDNLRGGHHAAAEAEAERLKVELGEAEAARLEVSPATSAADAPAAPRS
jgi:TRAP-type mannitol/chloroaromatic compound transport system permease small subunit